MDAESERTVALTVAGEEALGLARELAERRGTSIDEAVVTSLRASLAQVRARDPLPPRPVPVPEVDAFTPEQRARYDALRALVREVSERRLPGATSDHRDMYDENGLPI